jgi:glycosyltransferase involved in cell wall biosynthesis
MSNWAATAIRQEYGLQGSQVQVALPGANLRRWHFVTRSAERSTPVRILIVGGEFARKGGPLLLEWAQQTELRDWELDIVTWAHELPTFDQERLPHPAADRPASRLLGFQLPNVRVHTGMSANSAELRELYNRAHIFCLPTRADGTSNAALEAMATGLPVIVGAVGGIPELIQDGRDGLLIEPGNFAELRTTLERLVLDPELRQRLGRAARARCDEFLNTERQVRQILSVIDGDRPDPTLHGRTARSRI